MAELPAAIPAIQLHDEAFVLEALCYLDGLMVDEQVADFGRALQQDARRRRLFALLCLQTQTAREVAKPNMLLDQSIETLFRAGPAPARRLPRIRRWAAAAAMVVLSITVWLAWPHAPLNQTQTNIDQLGRVVEASTTMQWSEGQAWRSVKVGDDIGNGVLSLGPGQAVVQLDSGVQLTLLGPAQIQFDDLMRASLSMGEAMVLVEPRGRGYTLELPRMTLVDLGTHFRAVVDPAGRSRVEVYQGRVQMTAYDRDGRLVEQELVTGMVGQYADGLVTVSNSTQSPDIAAEDHSIQLLGHWPLDDWLDGKLEDLSPSGNAAQWHGTRPVGELPLGPVGRSLKLNGRDQFASIVTTPPVQLGRDPFTLAMWVSTSMTGRGALLYRKDTDQNPKIELLVDDGAIEFNLRDAEGHEVNAKVDAVRVNDQRWHHIAAIRTPNALLVYVNAKLMSQTPIPSDFGMLNFNQPAAWNIGSYVTGLNQKTFGYFQGQVDDLQIYRGELSPQQIQTLIQPGHDSQSNTTNQVQSSKENKS
ncbi:hypothetical protein HED60_09460 [Planctomycetales bacterium ZRK34]|nr:hypothetical protein HED60_09460 [Planctomycetales bacterium ZRK34]